jgi:undecaprenyl-diphosphatase
MKLRDKLNYRKTIVVAMALFIALGFMVSSTGYLEQFDLKFMEYIHKTENSTLEVIAKALSTIGSAWGYIGIGLVLFIWSLGKGKHGHFKLYTTAALGTSLLNQLLKLFYRRDRPFEFFRIDKGGFSFPSGHSMAAMGIYLILATILTEQYPRRKWLIWCASMSMVILIGWSRLYLGVHWPTDILGGYIGGLVAALIVLNIEIKKK